MPSGMSQLGKPSLQIEGMNISGNFLQKSLVLS